MDKNASIGLVFCCPYTDANPCDCPLHETRKLAPIERVHWWQGLSEAQIEEILKKHVKCLKNEEIQILLSKRTRM